MILPCRVVIEEKETKRIRENAKGTKEIQKAKVKAVTQIYLQNPVTVKPQLKIFFR